MVALKVNYKNQPMFFGEEVDIARFDILEYPLVDKFTTNQLGFFWLPDEIQDIIKDKNDFAGLTAHEKHIFTSNLLRQILLDSLQGRAPAETFGPLASVPEVENWIQQWTQSETIHSRSYTHIIRNVYPNPSDVFDKIPQIKEIVDCAADISKYYDELDRYNKIVSLFGYGHVSGMHADDSGGNSPDEFEFSTSLYEHKKLLWKCLMSVNILEGVRFYVSFACSWSFAERNLMEGNAKIIKLICRDENLHLGSTQYMLKELKRTDSDFAKIAKETEDECVQMFQAAIDQEKDWAKFLFKDGSMIGLTEAILVQYVDFIAKQRMKAVDLPCDYIKASTNNPLPWTNKWISGKDMQDAPQEVSKTQYRVGGVKSDLTSEGLKGFKL